MNRASRANTSVTHNTSSCKLSQLLWALASSPVKWTWKPNQRDATRISYNKCWSHSIKITRLRTLEHSWSQAISDKKFSIWTAQVWGKYLANLFSITYSRVCGDRKGSLSHVSQKPLTLSKRKQTFLAHNPKKQELGRWGDVVFFLLNHMTYSKGSSPSSPHPLVSRSVFLLPETTA